MQETATAVGVIGAIAGGGSLIAVVAFWFQRGKEIGALHERLEARRIEVNQRMDSIQASVVVAGAEAKLAREQLSEARVEIAREYVSHRDLDASESRIAIAIEGMRSEMTKLNDRLDRILEKKQ